MKAIFVVGTGRSGTHFTARLLNGFENVYDPLNGKEKSKILYDVARAAIHHRLPSRRTMKYYYENLNDQSGVFLDQHHPNLFFINHFNAMFDDIVFLYPHRPTHQVVASMLRHKGVMNWYKYAQKWRQRYFNTIPYPNQFFGLNRHQDICDVPLHILCALRVISHRLEYKRLVSTRNVRLISVRYEALISDAFAEFNRVFSQTELASLGRFSPVETPKVRSLYKFHEVLNDHEVAEIKALGMRMGVGD